MSNFLLVVMTSAGLQTSPGVFSSMEECHKVSSSLSVRNVVSYCISQSTINIEKEMTKMIQLMKKFQNEIQ
jgi:flagellar basal body rod protein FlgG